MASLEGIKRSEPNPFLFTRIELKLSQPQFKQVSKLKLSAAAVALVILIATNVWAIWSVKKDSSNETLSASGLSYFQSY